MKIFHLPNGNVLCGCPDGETRNCASDQIEVTVPNNPTILERLLAGWQYTYIGGVLEVVSKPASVVADEALAAAVTTAKLRVSTALNQPAQDRAVIDLVLVENGLAKVPTVVTPQEIEAARADLATANAGVDAGAQQTAWIKYHMLLDGITPK